MISRNRAMSLALLLCLLCGRTILSQEGSPGGPGEQPKVADRVRELEKQVRLLRKEVEALRNEIKPPNVVPPNESEVATFPLHDKADASKVAKALKALLHESEYRKIRIESDTSTNSVIVAGSSEDLKRIEKVLDSLAMLDRQTPSMPCMPSGTGSTGGAPSIRGSGLSGAPGSPHPIK